MSTTRLDEIGIFLLSNIFTSKINAMGISNLPTAITTVRAAYKDKGKKKQGRIVYFAGIFNSLVVVSGLTGRWPWLIKTNAVANIVNGVKESISARRKAESVSEDEVNQERPRKRSILSNAIKSRLFPSRKDSTEDASASSKEDEVDDSIHSSTSSTTGTATTDPSTSTSTQSGDVPVKSPGTSSLKNRFFSSKKSSNDTTSKSTEKDVEKSKRKKTLKKAQSLLAGKRESAMDDMIWGIFQISMIFYDMSWWQSVGRAWMVFLCHVLEETALNDKLTRKQKMRKFAYLTVTAYLSGRIVFK